MKIAMEPGSAGELEGEMEPAVAIAAIAQFGGQGDLREALAEVDRLSRQRLDWRDEGARLCA